MLCLNMEMKNYLTKYLPTFHSMKVLYVTVDDCTDKSSLFSSTIFFFLCVTPIALDTFPALVFVHSFCSFICLFKG